MLCRDRWFRHVSDIDVSSGSDSGRSPVRGNHKHGRLRRRTLHCLPTRRGSVFRDRGFSPRRRHASDKPCFWSPVWNGRIPARRRCCKPPNGSVHTGERSDPFADLFGGSGRRRHSRNRSVSRVELLRSYSRILRHQRTKSRRRLFSDKRD